MTHRLNKKEVVFLALFFTLQFFWLTASFANSETSDRMDRDRSERDAAAAPAPAPAPTPTPTPTPTPASTIGGIDTIASLSITPPPDLALGGMGGDEAQLVFLKTEAALAQNSSGFDVGNDLGHQIKYCIVYPFLQDAGWPIPPSIGGDGDCEISTSTPPRLSVLKVVVNDDGGVGTISSFTLRVGASTVTSGTVYAFAPGTYQVSEATTTATVGTTTTQYVQTFSGACNSSGTVTLAQGDSKVCILTNNDAGPGTTVTPPPPPPSPGGGSTDVSPPPSGGGGGPGPSGGGGGGSPSPSPSGGGGGGSPSPTPPGIVLGTTTPNVPNTGTGGSASATFLALILSLTTTLLGATFLVRFRSIN